MIRSTLLILALSVAFAAGQNPPYLGQCRGIDYTGTTSPFDCNPPFSKSTDVEFLAWAACVSGTVCTELNPYYSQCLPEAPTTPVDTAADQHQQRADLN
jgi:hypothetical protein